MRTDDVRRRLRIRLAGRAEDAEDASFRVAGEGGPAVDRSDDHQVVDGACAGRRRRAVGRGTHSSSSVSARRVRRAGASARLEERRARGRRGVVAEQRGVGGGGPGLPRAFLGGPEALLGDLVNEAQGHAAVRREHLPAAGLARGHGVRRRRGDEGDELGAAVGGDGDADDAGDGAARVGEVGGYGVGLGDGGALGQAHLRGARRPEAEEGRG